MHGPKDALLRVKSYSDQTLYLISGAVLGFHPRESYSRPRQAKSEKSMDAILRVSGAFSSDLRPRNTPLRRNLTTFVLEILPGVEIG